LGIVDRVENAPQIVHRPASCCLRGPILARRGKFPVKSSLDAAEKAPCPWRISGPRSGNKGRNCNDIRHDGADDGWPLSAIRPAASGGGRGGISPSPCDWSRPSAS